MNIFLKKFSRFLLIGLSAFILLAASNQAVLGDSVYALPDDCLQPEQPGCDEPGGGIGPDDYSTPYDTPYDTPYAYPTPAYDTPYSSPYVTPAAAQACTPGDYRRTCTGQCGGCAANAGESRIEQCLADGSGFTEQQSECRTECAGPCQQAYAYPTPAYTYPTPAYTYPTPAYAYPTPAYNTPYAYPTPGSSYTYPTPAYAYPTPAYAYPTPAYTYPTPGSGYTYPTPYTYPSPAVASPAPAVVVDVNQGQQQQATGGAATATGGAGGSAQVGTVVASSNSSAQGGSATVNVSAPQQQPAQQAAARPAAQEVRVVTAQAPTQPQVVRVAGVSTAIPVQELPKTGLPLLAWAAGAFLPMGFGLKKFSGNIKEDKDNPRFLWDQRKYRRE